MSFLYKINDKVYRLDMGEIYKILDGVPVDSPAVLKWLRKDIVNGVKEIKI